MKKTICFIAVASLLLTTVSFCKNDKQEVKEESGKIRYTHPIQPAAITAHTDFSFIFLILGMGLGLNTFQQKIRKVTQIKTHH